MFSKKEKEMWEILDAASQRADNYNKEENLLRFQRYMKEGVGLEDPITIGTVFRMAADHGWQGWSPSMTPAVLPPVTWSAAELQVSFSNIPHRPPCRTRGGRELVFSCRWLRIAALASGAPGSL